MKIVRGKDCIVFGFEKSLEEQVEDLKRKMRLRDEQIAQLQTELDSERDAKEHAEFKIKTELEPRIKAEQRSYDAYVTTPRGAEACEALMQKLDDIISLVTNDPQFFDWEDKDGDIYEKILYLIKNEQDVAIMDKE